VVLHHAEQAYGPTGGVYMPKNTKTSDWLGKFFLINATYMMEL
jgi:hypothetical protein